MTDDVNPVPETTAAPPAETASAPGAAMSSALPEEELTRLTDGIIAALKTVYDPEIPSDIYELGLIYNIDIADDRAVAIEMTLTTPNCPSAQELPTMVENAVAAYPASARSRSISCGIRPGTPAACRTKPALSSTCGEA